MGKKLTKYEIDYITENYKHLTREQIAESINRSYVTVNRYLKKFNLSAKRKLQNLKIRDFEKFLDSGLDKYTAYLLGFIAADGYINNKYNRITIELSINDYLFLSKLNEYFNFPYKLKTRTSNNSVSLHICSKYLAMKLTEVYKITPKKSLTLEFSENIPEHLIKYFILGYFDGDGSVCCYKPKSSPNVNLDFSILGTNNMMNHFKNHINKHVPEAKGSIFKQQNYYVLSISGTKSAIYFGEWLFSDTDFPINLKRKQEKFTNYVKEWGFLKTAKRGSGFGKNKNLSI